MDSAARSGGVSRSDCRHVMEITTQYELEALIWDYLLSLSFCIFAVGEFPLGGVFYLGTTKKMTLT